MGTLEERTTAFRAWADAASRTERGALVLANLAHELSLGSLPRSVLRRFVETLAELWMSNPSAQPEKVLREALDELGNEALCQGQPPLEAPQRCSRVMATQDFFRRHVNHVAVGLVPDSEGVPPHYIQRLESGGLARYVGGTLTTSKPVVWVTDSRRLDEMRRRTTSDLATTLRHRLGLIHYGDGQQLLEVVYPSDSVPNAHCTLHPPTFLDGASSTVYRSKRSESGWGTTVDLASGEDGLPEAVHPPMELNERFRVRDLGTVGAGQKSSPPVGLSERVPAPWGPDYINLLLGYLEDN